MPIKEEQTAKSQHPVPQNIMSVEFKLVGDLTVRQFVYLVIGGIISYLSFVSKLPFFWKWFSIIIGGGGGLSLAFVPLGDRGLDQWIRNFITSVFSPTQRVWAKSPQIPKLFLSDYADILKSEVVTLAPAKSRVMLEKYLETVKEEKKTKLDLQEEKFLESINYDIELPSKLKEEILPAPKVLVEEYPKEKSEERWVPEWEKYEKKKKEEKEPKKLLIAPKEPKKPTVSPIKKSIEKQKPPKPIKGTYDIQKIPTLSNIKVSRALRHVPVEGEIILPKKEGRVIQGKTARARTEKISKEELEAHRKELLKKAKDLKRTLNKVQQKFTPEGGVLPARELVIGNEKEVKTIKIPDKESKQKLEALKKQNELLISQIEELKSKMKSLDKSNRKYEEQLRQYKQTIEEIEKRKAKISKSVEKVKIEKRHEEPKETPKAKNKLHEKEQAEELLKKKVTEAIKVKKPARTEKKQEVPLSNIPNIIQGTVKDYNKKLLENATILIKDEGGDPVRALKTNRLGEFITSTPLPNGTYTVEILNNENIFDIMTISLDGSVIKPIEFKSKGKRE